MGGFTEPTHSSDWVDKGDACVSSGGMRGRVLRIIDHASLPVAEVLWENGHQGRISITQLRREVTTPSRIVDRFLNRDFANDGRLDECESLRAQLIEEQEAVHNLIAALASQ